MKAAGMKRFFVALIVFSIMMLVTEAQTALTPTPTPAPAPAPAPVPSPIMVMSDVASDMSAGAIAMPTFGVAVPVVMVLFGYLYI
ncbi:hypothetical protein FCM35_KLT00679 [Carex littledalei]|uniref:Arabinogalactan-like protein n=1 Tax=Carex littledalei TaxID=544730 RepID=A0A833VLS2_9POAL|nr:hypothetical protein FCM35_KLT00679 [Carex littledalei]